MDVSLGSMARRLAEIETENARLKHGLNIIAQAGLIHGGAWCVAQALGHLHDLDFDTYPETGRPPEDAFSK
jgi:hypothetical protein